MAERRKVTAARELVPYVPTGGDRPLPPLNQTLLRDLVLWAAGSYWASEDDVYVPWFEGYQNMGIWNQKSWAELNDLPMEVNGTALQAEINRCHSSFCIAGNAVAEMGYALIPEGVTDVDSYRDFLKGGGHGDWRANYAAPRRFSRLDERGKPLYEIDFRNIKEISDVAQRALGLHSVEATLLFEGGNSIGNIVDLAIRFHQMRGVYLDLPDEVEALAEPSSTIVGYYESHINDSWTLHGVYKGLIDDGALDDPFRRVRQILVNSYNEDEITHEEYMAATAALAAP